MVPGSGEYCHRAAPATAAAAAIPKTTEAIRRFMTYRLCAEDRGTEGGYYKHHARCGKHGARRWKDAVAAAARRCLLSMALIAGTAHAQAPKPTPKPSKPININYVYAAEFGFGAYDVGGLDVAVYSLPLRHVFRDVLRPGWNLLLRYPVQYGYFHLSGNSKGRKEETFNSVALVPGAELLIPVTPQWKVKPFIEAGVGSLLNELELFYVFNGGAASTYEIPMQNEFTLLLGGAFAWAGDDQVNGGGPEHYTTIKTGIELRRPLGFQIENLVPDLGAFFISHFFLPAAEFDQLGAPPILIVNQWEVGFTVGSVTPIKWLWLTDQRIGVSYRFGGLDAVRVSLGFGF